jgi:hypothetical protein
MRIAYNFVYNTVIKILQYKLLINRLKLVKNQKYYKFKYKKVTINLLVLTRITYIKEERNLIYIVNVNILL